MIDSKYLKGNVDILADIIKCIGLLSKESFDKKIGIDNIYINGLLQIIPRLLKIGA